MKKKILVTTALKSTWDLENDMIFLGNWCEKYDNFESVKKKSTDCHLKLFGLIVYSPAL